MLHNVRSEALEGPTAPLASLAQALGVPVGRGDGDIDNRGTGRSTCALCKGRTVAVRDVAPHNGAARRACTDAGRLWLKHTYVHSPGSFRQERQRRSEAGHLWPHHVPPTGQSP